ncbi:hypothetical protein [Caulobacter sp. RHG1]|uniref:hypothetical protein n=1 Tax=Caulobacter sp. (strain RHG1) TaxID=2545762 RepID=UPI0015521B1F|nr:hypothetical protein [Caulobacter sp. RHG1]NQE60975.1 hypothetical protein [Caulobacter sp. RHG1]
MSELHETPASEKKLKQVVYEGVTEERRPTVIRILWLSKAIKVDAVKTGETYTITALIEVPAAE